jgi:hypothetical protein
MKVNQFDIENIGVDLSKEKFTLSDINRGAIVEEEHGMRPDLNITNSNPIMSAKIALAHLYEREDYYDGLEIVEEAPHGYWHGVNSEWFLRVANAQFYAFIIIALFCILYYCGIISANVFALLTAVICTLMMGANYCAYFKDLRSRI